MWSLLAFLVSEFRRCFTLCLFIILLVQFGSLSGTFWEIAADRLAICSHCILSTYNNYLFPVLVLRAGFAF